MSPATVEFTPISFPVPHDPLGTALTSSKPPEENYIHEIKRPSLTRIILSLQTPLKQQESLAHVLTALQIAYARDAIVNSLGGVASAAQKSTSGENVCEQDTLAEISASTIAAPQDSFSSNGNFGTTSPDRFTDTSRKRHMQIPSGLDDFTSMLTVEDARVLVDLLKLAVANRVGEKGKETLGAVLTAMGKANSEVCTLWDTILLGPSPPPWDISGKSPFV